MCVVEHLSDESIEHKVLQLKNSKLTPDFPIHNTNPCERHCVQCDSPVCAKCSTAGKHVQHSIIDIVEIFNDKRKAIQKDIEELEKSLSPQFQNISEKSAQLTKDLDEQGKVWKEEIYLNIQILTTYRDKFDSKQMALLRRQKDKISHIASEVT